MYILHSNNIDHKFVLRLPPAFLPAGIGFPIISGCLIESKICMLPRHNYQLTRSTPNVFAKTYTETMDE